MKRREAIKNIGFAAGFAVIAPSFLSMLQSCTTEKLWTPKFLKEDEQKALINIVDIILPKTENTPSATEMNVPQFIDKYIDEVLELEDQEITRAGFANIISKLKSNPEDSIDDVNTEQYTTLLDKYILLKGEDDAERLANPEGELMTTSEFLGQIKWMTINAFLTSEYVGENILVYEPIPTAYYCGDLQELTGGKSYSL